MQVLECKSIYKKMAICYYVLNETKKLGIR